MNGDTASFFLGRGVRAVIGGIAAAALVASPVLGYRQGPLPDRVYACGFGPTCGDIGCHESFPIDTTQLPWRLEQETGPLPPGYVGRRQYRLRLTIDERPSPFASIWGFELAPLVASACPFSVAAGDVTEVDASRTRRFTDRGVVYLSHRCTCANEDPACCGFRPQAEPSLIEWSLLWDAPAQGTGDVTFAMAFNAANWDGTRDGDRITVASVILPEDATCPPQARDLRVRRESCDPGAPGEERLRLDWSRGGAPYRIRSTTDVRAAPRDRALWADDGTSDCLAPGPAPLVFYSVAEECGSGAEGAH